MASPVNSNPRQSKGSTFLEERVDPQGQYFLKGKIRSTTVTLANVYLQKSDHLTFLRSLVPILLEFREGTFLLDWDFNFFQEPLLDVSRGASHFSYSYLKKLKAELFNLNLVDPWRIMHPKDRDYTYFSSVQRKYSRIDFFPIQHKAYSDSA